MEFLALEQLPAAMPHALAADQILAMCQRAFGPAVRVVAARQLGGGTFNTTFLITLSDQRVILRIAPAPTADLAWDERWLMRREQHIQPFFAALASRMPRTLMADFTQQLIDRDYVFQTYLAGERWEELAGQLTFDQELQLWEQFGGITKTIHNAIGTSFGGPYPAPEFPTWSQTICYRLERAAQAMAEARLDLTDLQAVLAIVRGQSARLDAVLQPRLLHGDLWLFNLLITRETDRPAISGVLDAERAWWGDPLADWTMFVLAKATAPAAEPYHARFWQAYGQPEHTPEVAFRQAVYEAMHIGTALVWASHHDDADTLQRGTADLRAVVELLPSLV